MMSLGRANKTPNFITCGTGVYMLGRCKVSRWWKHLLSLKMYSNDNQGRVSQYFNFMTPWGGLRVCIILMTRTCINIQHIELLY